MYEKVTPTSDPDYYTGKNEFGRNGGDLITKVWAISAKCVPNFIELVGPNLFELRFAFLQRPWRYFASSVAERRFFRPTVRELQCVYPASSPLD
mgnify:CR=1 FL=1